MPQGLLSGLAVGLSRQGADVPSHLSLRPPSLAPVLPGNFFHCSDLLYGFLIETGAHQHQTITAPTPEKKNLIAGRDGEGWGIGLVEDGGGGGRGALGLWSLKLTHSWGLFKKKDTKLEL